MREQVPGQVSISTGFPGARKLAFPAPCTSLGHEPSRLCTCGEGSRHHSQSRPSEHHKRWLVKAKVLQQWRKITRKVKGISGHTELHTSHHNSLPLWPETRNKGEDPKFPQVELGQENGRKMENIQVKMKPGSPGGQTRLWPQSPK